jgi:hypothetical protein
MITGAVTFNAASANIFLNDSWQTEASTVTDSGTDNRFELIGV